MIKLAEMRAFSFGVARLKHANFLCETKSLCRFSGVKAIFALDFSVFCANRKLVPMAPKFRKNHEMHVFAGAIFHVLQGCAGKDPSILKKVCDGAHF